MMTVVFFTTRREIKMAFNFYMTEFGKAATIHSLAGGKITIDNVEIGSSATAPTDYNTITNLLNRELKAQIISQKKIDNTFNLKFQFDNKKVTNDFFWTETAVFATVTKADNSIETGIIIYGYNEENANHIPAYADNNSLNKFICQIGINYSDELNVTIKLDEFNDYVENSEFTEHLNSENPHGITPDMINAAKAEHCHSANDIASGILGVERGGTGHYNLSTFVINDVIPEMAKDVFYGNSIENQNLDDLKSAGIYFCVGSPGPTNGPGPHTLACIVLPVQNGSMGYIQIAIAAPDYTIDGNLMWIREFSHAQKKWRSWRTLG